MKRVYICGDSFSSSDSEYGSCWVDLLTDLLQGQAEVINLSSVAASNLLISLQVHRAVSQAPDFVICHGTAVTRGEVCIGDSNNSELFDRFVQKNLVAYSIFRPYRSDLTAIEQKEIQQFHAKYFDLDLAIYRDQCIIENTLQRLTSSAIPFLFDQGGFEHKKYSGNSQLYFLDYADCFSAVNLWDHGDTVDERPYFHIKDIKIHQEVANYYYEQIKTIL